MTRFKHAIHLSLAVVLVGSLVAGTIAQETDKPLEPTRTAVIVSGVTGDGNVLQIQTSRAAPLMLAPDVSGGAMYSFSGLGGAGAWSNSIGWLNDDNLLDELDIIDEQRDQLQSYRDEVLQKRRDFFNSYRAVAPEKRGDFMREFGELLSADVDKKVNEILLPHQKKRLAQIQFQTRMRTMGMGAFERDTLVKELGITDEQLELLREKQKKVQEELRKKLEELRKEAQNEVISVLTEEQQKKIREMMGEDYEFKPRKFTPPTKVAPTKPVKK